MARASDRAIQQGLKRRLRSDCAVMVAPVLGSGILMAQRWDTYSPPLSLGREKQEEREPCEAQRIVGPARTNWAIICSESSPTRKKKEFFSNGLSPHFHADRCLPFHQRQPCGFRQKKNAIYVCIIAEKVNKQKNYPDE